MSISNIPKVKIDLPQISTEQMIEIDRLMIDYYGITLIQMMERAGLQLARLAQMFAKAEDSFLVFTGTGGNGGGAMVAARTLAGWGRHVQVRLSKSIKEYRGTPAHQLNILQQLKVDVKPFDAEEELMSNIIIDGIIGYSINGNPRGVAAKMIDCFNGLKAKKISLDTPSGIELTHGSAFKPSVKADATLTLALPKKGLFFPEIKKQVGQLLLADIGVPLQLYHKMGVKLEANPFEESDIIRLY